ncbi:hypothetical protein [Deinococcus sp.]|uniref:hypothetical protein n=1 Tax=Deinococcus sp. TaxID=47478 RepID=UPI0025C6F468|nr:hypothetical protein [Deinococcus sp.]
MPDHLQLILLQGLALADFTVFGIHWLYAQTGQPVLVVAGRSVQVGADLGGRANPTRSSLRLCRSSGFFTIP